MRAIGLIMCFLVTIVVTAQNQRDAIKMNEGIFPVSLYVGYNNDILTPGRLTPGYDYSRDINDSFLIGTEFMFAKSGKFQSTIGVYYKKSFTTGNLFVPAASLGVENDFSFRFSNNHDMLQVPLKIAFIQKITPSFYVNINGGVTYARLFHDNINITNSLTVGNQQVIGFSSFTVQEVNKIQYEMAARVSYKTPKSGLYSLEFMYHIGSAISQDLILSENIPNEQEYISRFTLTGKYTTISLHWSPPKSWFQKKQ